MYDIVLISPDHSNTANNFPWGVLALGSYLRHVAHCSVRLVDASALSREAFLDELKVIVDQTTLIGISCYTTDVPFVKEVVDRIKDMKKEVNIIVGGHHAILMPEQTVSYKNIDFVASDDAEETLVALIRERKEGTPALETVPGLYFKKNDVIMHTQAKAFRGFYDIDYSLLPDSTQRTLGQYVQVLTGRGCSYKCLFCYNSVMSKPFMPRAIEDVNFEVRRLVNEYDPQVIYFRDENFFQNKERVCAFIEMYKAEGFTFRWRATCRINYFRDDYINAEFLRELESINCEVLKIGVESGSQRVLNYLKKGITLSQITYAVELLSASRITGEYSFMIGLPTQTRDEYVETLNLVRDIVRKDSTAKIIGPQYFRIYPGGVLFNEIVKQYPVALPESFKGWADVMGVSTGNAYQGIQYSWIPRRGYPLARFAQEIVMIARMTMRDMFTLWRLPFIPLFFFVKVRFLLGFYSCLWDVAFISWCMRVKQRMRVAEREG